MPCLIYRQLNNLNPWKINVVDISLQYARDREARKIALTIALAYSTINEWYYLVRGEEKAQEVDHREGQIFSFGIPTYPGRYFYSLYFQQQCSHQLNP